MYFDPIYALQRKTIARKMHSQVNKLYLRDHPHPYLKGMHDLHPQYVYRIQALLSMAEDAVKYKQFDKTLLHRALLEVAANPCAQMKLSYTELVDIKLMCSDYASQKRAPEDLARTIAICTQRLLPRIPDVLPCQESAAQQMADMHDVVEWMLMTYDYSVSEIICYTEEKYLHMIAYTSRNCVHPKAPHITDYLMNLHAVVYSSIRMLCRPKYAKEDTSIIYWCCMYLRYCAPGFLDCASVNNDAYTKTMHVLNILNNEWKYLQAKCK